MRTAFLVAGAAILVAGASLIALAPFYVSTGFYSAELKSVQAELNASASPSVMYSAYSGYANTGNWIAVVGAIIAPVGAALLAYGLSTKKPEAPEENVPRSTESIPA